MTVVRGGAGHRIRTGADTRLALIGLGAEITVVATGPIRSGRIRAQSGARVAHSGIVTVILVVSLIMFSAAWFIVLPIVFLVWAGLVLLLLYKNLNVHYQLTTQKFIHRSGILRRVTDRIEAKLCSEDHG